MAQAKTSAPTSLYRNRRSFAKIPDVMDVPNLIAIQTESFEWFKEEGLAQAFADVCPIENNTKDMCVEFGRHEFGEPKYTVDECKEKDVSYQAPLFVEIRFINRETGEIKEQDVFMGDFPLMTPRGTFIINGTERVVVSQLVRSPGVYFAAERDKTSDKTIYNAKVIPSRGAWLEFETDKRDVLSVRIDRKRKQPATLLLRALGLAETREEIIELLGNDEMVLRTLDRDPATTKEESLIELYKRFRPGEPPTIDSARTLLEGLFFNPQRYDLAKVGRYKINKKLGFDPDFEAVHAHRRGHHQDHAVHRGAACRRRGRHHRRHRPLRQPPHPHGGRADPEPVPHRPVAHGARRARAHEHAGARRDHAAVPGEHPPHRGGHQGVLRKFAAVPVHGPDEPRRRHHAQAPPVGPGPGRPVPRARRLRGARRAHLPLRPHVPHRDA